MNNLNVVGASSSNFIVLVDLRVLYFLYSFTDKQFKTSSCKYRPLEARIIPVARFCSIVCVVFVHVVGV